MPPGAFTPAPAAQPGGQTIESLLLRLRKRIPELKDAYCLLEAGSGQLVIRSDMLADGREFLVRQRDGARGLANIATSYAATAKVPPAPSAGPSADSLAALPPLTPGTILVHMSYALTPRACAPAPACSR